MWHSFDLCASCKAFGCPDIKQTNILRVTISSSRNMTSLTTTPFLCNTLLPVMHIFRLNLNFGCMLMAQYPRAWFNMSWLGSHQQWGARQIQVSKLLVYNQLFILWLMANCEFLTVWNRYFNRENNNYIDDKTILMYSLRSIP